MYSIRALVSAAGMGAVPQLRERGGKHWNVLYE
jgi:hypothetical protein